MAPRSSPPMIGVSPVARSSIVTDVAGMGNQVIIHVVVAGSGKACTSSV
eukprot:CAMPEP_0205936332 /NCGR_PEP_ID=MMETSP1325-20131115/41355_1 /ASSEMBLY_ACC=CAM_ASM_000708 /TAXON_ID=236786 /ORGANISM="Florenciella sp., Strain RCC1007" /LENGTH=48 /DNA_ID= /DNA_START= /DNA_END= /DNA_ORIENTATION=